MDSVAHQSSSETGSCTRSRHDLSANKTTRKRVDKPRKLTAKEKKEKLNSMRLPEQSYEDSRPHTFIPHHLIKKWRNESIECFIATEGKAGCPSASPYTVQELLPFVPRKEAVRLAKLSVPLPTSSNSTNLGLSLLPTEDLRYMNQAHELGFITPCSQLFTHWPASQVNDLPTDEPSDPDSSHSETDDATPAAPSTSFELDGVNYTCRNFVPRSSGLNYHISLDGSCYTIENGLVIDPSEEFSDVYMICTGLYFEHGGGDFTTDVPSPAFQTGVLSSFSIDYEYCEEFIEFVAPSRYHEVEFDCAPQYARFSNGPRSKIAKMSDPPAMCVLPFFNKYVSLVFVLVLSFHRNRTWDARNEPTMVYHNVAVY